MEKLAQKTTVFIVDDHKLIREMWAKMFAVKSDVEVCGESGTFDEAIELIKSKRPNIVLLDINLPNASGLDAVPLIRKYSPGTKIIAVSMHNEPAYFKRMLRLGAKGYVTKNSSHEEMLKAVDEVMKGGTYVCAEIVDIVMNQTLGDEPQEGNLKKLSLREIEIIQLIKEGYSSKEIASKLSISVRTAEVHRHNILKKLKIKNTAALITFINNSDLTFG